MKKQRDQRGFTLMELMVVIVIVAILAAVAVPLYINYVNDAQRTEAKGAIGAIITAEQAHFQKYGDYIAYGDADFTTPPADDAARLNCDIRDAQKNWEFTVTAVAADPAATPPVGANFTVTAKGRTGTTYSKLQVKYTLTPASGTSQWDDSPPSS